MRKADVHYNAGDRSAARAAGPSATAGGRSSWRGRTFRPAALVEDSHELSIFQRGRAGRCGGTLAAVPARAAEQFINVLTGGTSGVYYPLGVALSTNIGKALPGAKTSVQATKASVENLNLLQAGRGEIAFTLGDSLSDAWKGKEEAGFKTPLKKLRGIAAIYPNYIQIVARADTGIKTLADLKGKRISVGAPRSGTELNARAILERSRHRLQGFRQGRVPAVWRIRRAHEEQAARRDIAIRGARASPACAISRRR